MELPPIGYVPSQRTFGGGLHHDCEPKRNYAAQLYNARMQEFIADDLGKDAVFPTLVVYIDIYNILQERVDSGEQYSFTETTRGCCGTGTIEVTGKPSCATKPRLRHWSTTYLSRELVARLRPVLGTVAEPKRD